jgi:hypothetical protein
VTQPVKAGAERQTKNQSAFLLCRDEERHWPCMMWKPPPHCALQVFCEAALAMAASLPAYFTQLPTEMDIAWLAVAYAQGLSPLSACPSVAWPALTSP